MENPVLNASSRGLVGSFKLSAMKGIIAIVCLTGLWALAIADGLSEYTSPEYSRVFRPALDLKATETRPTKLKTGNQRKSRPTPQTLYGGQDQVRLAPSRTPSKKFKPSPQDPYFPSDVLSYAPSHKYLQKYATQLYTTQKNSGQLSEYQKYILGQDPAVKKFVFGRTPKKIEDVSETVKIVSSTVRPTTTDKPKIEQKAEVADNAAQSTQYKFIFKPEYIPVPVYTTDDKTTYSGYDFTTAQHLSPSYSLGDQLTYKLPATSYGHGAKLETDTLTYKLPATTYGQGAKLDSHQFTYKLPAVSYGGKHEEEHHEYPTTEPKYEFQYAVKDHEKNSNFGHAEARQGKKTWGKYYVQLSDGRLETVKYWADKTGYHAEVDFKGHAKHPQSKPKELASSHGFSAGGDLKLFQHQTVQPELYSVSEVSPIEYH